MFNLVAGFFVGGAAIGLIIAVVGLGVIIRGWALSTLWGWFVVPLFALPSLSIASAYGIALIYGVLNYHSTRAKCAGMDEKEKQKQDIKEIISILASPIVSVGIGWVVKTYFM